MPKIYLSPSLQTANLCKFGDTESDHCQMYTDLLEQYLNASGIETRRNRGASFPEVLAESGEYKPDFHYAPHTNAFNGATRYSVLLVFSTNTASPAAACCAHIKSHRARLYPRPIYINQNRQIYEVLRTKAPCIYDEILFHDNDEDCRLFHAHMQEFARLTALGFCDHFGLPLVEPAAIPADAPAAGCHCNCNCGETDDCLQSRYDTSRQELAALKARYETLLEELRTLMTGHG